MKTRFILLLSLSLCLIGKISQAQYITKVTGYFKTYDDFVNGNFQKMDELKSDFEPYGNTLVFILDGKKVKIRIKDIWGFRAGYGTLYRVYHPKDEIFKVVEVGKIILYYYGKHTYMTMSYGHGGQIAESTPFYCFSSDLNSDIERFIKYNEKTGKEILSKYPQYKLLFECIGDDSDADSKIVPCVESFNSGKL